MSSVSLYPHLRVVYMSGYPGGAASRLGALGSDAAYLEKPFSPTTLAEKIQAAMKGIPKNDEVVVKGSTA